MQAVLWCAGRNGLVRALPSFECGMVRYFATTTKGATKANTSSKINKLHTAQKIIASKSNTPETKSKPYTKHTNNKSADTKTNPTNKNAINASKTTHKIPSTTKPSKGLPAKGKTTKVETTKNQITQTKTTKLAPQVGDLERKRKKEIPIKEAVVRGEKINEVSVKGELVRDENVERTGKVVKGHTTGETERRRGTKGEIVKGEKISDGMDVQGELVKEDAMERVGQVIKGDATAVRPMADILNDISEGSNYKDEDDVDDPELAGYGEETYDYFTKNVAKLGKSAYSHYLEKIKQFLEYDQQYFAVRLFTFMVQSMKVAPDLYEIMILNFLEKSRFSNAFFYLDQMKTRELKPTDAILEGFFTFFSKHPNKANQTKFETLLSSFGLPTTSTHAHRRQR